MLGAFTVAGITYFALAAVVGECVAFILAELALEFRADHVAQRLVQDISQLVLRIDVVIAGVDIPVVFHRHGGAAGGAEDAEAASHSHRVTQCDIKDLDEYLADILPYPFVENGGQEFSIGFWFEAPVRDGQADFPLLIDSRGCGQIEAEFFRFIIGQSFHQWNELDEAGTDLLEEAVDFERFLGVDPVDDCQRVEFDAVFFEQFEPVVHPFIGGIAFFIHAIGVVEFRRAVDAQADEEMVFGKEFTPFVVQQGAVGLQGVADLSATGVFLLQGNRFPEKVDSQQRRFSSLPGEGDFRHALLFDVLADVGLQYFVRHFEVFVGGEELFFFQIKAVFAVEITQRPDGLGHHMKCLNRQDCLVSC